MRFLLIIGLLLGSLSHAVDWPREFITFNQIVDDVRNRIAFKLKNIFKTYKVKNVSYNKGENGAVSGSLALKSRVENVLFVHYLRKIEHFRIETIKSVILKAALL